MYNEANAQHQTSGYINADLNNPVYQNPVETYSGLCGQSQDYPTLVQQAIKQQQASGIGGTSNVGISAAGTAKPQPLTENAAAIREQVDRVYALIREMELRLFVPPAMNGIPQGETKDNPSSLEGNLQHTSRTLASVLFKLDAIVNKIGGR